MSNSSIVVIENVFNPFVYGITLLMILIFIIFKIVIITTGAYV